MRLAAIVLVAACGGETTKPGTLALVDPGTEPRVTLQYALGAFERDIAFVSEIDVESRKDTFADMRYRLKCGPNSCRYQMVKFEVLGEGSNFEGVKKAISGTIQVPANGLVSITADGMMKTTPSTPELFKSVLIPLPGDAIGMGARWTVTEPGGTATRTFRLVKNDGATLTIETRVEANDPQMKFAQAGEVAVKLTDPFGTGTLELVQTVPADPSIKMDTHSFHQRMKIESLSPSRRRR